MISIRLPSLRILVCCAVASPAVAAQTLPAGQSPAPPAVAAAPRLFDRPVQEQAQAAAPPAARGGTGRRSDPLIYFNGTISGPDAIEAWVNQLPLSLFEPVAGVHSIALDPDTRLLQVVLANGSKRHLRAGQAIAARPAPDGALR